MMITLISKLWFIEVPNSMPSLLMIKYSYHNPSSSTTYQHPYLITLRFNTGSLVSSEQPAATFSVSENLIFGN